MARRNIKMKNALERLGFSPDQSHRVRYWETERFMQTVRDRVNRNPLIEQRIRTTWGQRDKPPEVVALAERINRREGWKGDNRQRGYAWVYLYLLEGYDKQTALNVAERDY